MWHKIQTEEAKNTKHKKMKKRFSKTIGRKCRLMKPHIEQNNDHAQITHEIKFSSSFNSRHSTVLMLCPLTGLVRRRNCKWEVFSGLYE